MLLALMFPLVTADPSSAVSPPVLSDPPIKIWLNSDGQFTKGDHAKVRVKATDDGYLLVFRATTEGRVRVLFPLDPGDDNFIRGGKTYEVKGRGDRESFTVDDGTGTGSVYAAISTDPFHFDEYTRGDHWDYRVLGASKISDDEQLFNEIVDKMTAGGHYEYDFVSYQVGTPYAYDDGYWYPGYHRHYDPFYGDCFGCGYRSGVSFSIGFNFGYPHRHHFYSPAYYDPFFYDPFFYDPFYYDPFYYRPVVVYPYATTCYYYPGCYGYRPYRPYRPVYGFKPGVPTVPGAPGGGVGYRPRYWLTGGLGGAPTPVSPRPRGSSDNPSAGTVDQRRPSPRNQPGVTSGTTEVRGRRSSDGGGARPASPAGAETPRRETDRRAKPATDDRDRGAAPQPSGGAVERPGPGADVPQRRGLEEETQPGRDDQGRRGGSAQDGGRGRPEATPAPTRRDEGGAREPRRAEAPPPERPRAAEPPPRRDPPPERRAEPARRDPPPPPPPAYRPPPSSGGSGDRGGSSGGSPRRRPN